MRFVGHHDEALDGGYPLAQLLEQRHEGQIEEDEAVGRVIDDVGDLVVEQARVDGVAHRADARDAVVELEVPVAVPRQRRDPVAATDADRLECIGEPLDARVGVGVGIAMDRPLDRLRDDLDRAMTLRPVPDQRRDQQGHVHHQPVHPAASLPVDSLLREFYGAMPGPARTAGHITRTRPCAGPPRNAPPPRPVGTGRARATSRRSWCLR